jgi:CBS domain-containing protein
VQALLDKIGIYFAIFLGMHAIVKPGNGSNMILEDVIVFLKKVPPFQFLDDEALQSIARNLSLEFYPKDTVILKQDEPPSDALRIIKKGGVKVSMTSEGGDEVVIDYRGEGDTFGFLSMVGKDRVRSNITAVEDTICYLLGKEMLLKLLDSHLSFTEYFFKSHITKYIDRTYGEMSSKSLYYGSSDHLLFTTPIGEIATKKVVTIHQQASIREAAQKMVDNRISSLIIMDSHENPVGIVTDRDMREKVVAKGRSGDDPIKNIMALPMVRVDAKDFCFEAVLKMIKHNIHHILVIKEGKLTGVLTNHDLMLLQGTSPLSFAKDVESQHSIEGLVPVSIKINRVVGLLLKEGARASNVAKIIAELNDRLVRKILEIAERKFGPAPLNYCWIVFGSEGRREQTFKTDQDNGLIYENPKTVKEAKAAEAYFQDFTAFVHDAIVQCGFPPCPGGYMASNRKWRQPLSRWKDYFREWINTPTSEAILFSAILFDFRSLHGEASLAEALRDHLHATLKDRELFLKKMADMAMLLRPPLGFFRTFVVEKTGEHKNELNLKFKCIAPLLDIVRLYSLELGVRETSTLERIAALKGKHSVVTELGDEMEQVFDFLMLLRIHHQYEQIKNGKDPDNFINPNNLTNLEKKTLKEACQFISRLQDALAKQYSPGTVM